MSKTFDEIAAEQGWNADSREQILREFIASGGTDLDDYALKRAFEENGVEHEGRLVPDFVGSGSGNYYVNDKCTGAVVGQQPFGGGRASGTNDKAGSILNLYRWVSARTIKETGNPPKDCRYPYLG